MDERWVARLKSLRKRWLPLLLVTIAPLILNLSATPRDLITSLERTHFAIQRGQPAPAAEALEGVLKWADHHPLLRIQAAQFALAANEPGRAILLLEEEVNPSDVAGKECLKLQTQVLLANPTGAQNLLLDAPAQCPLPIVALEDLARRSLEQQDPETALFFYQELRKLRPEDPAYWRSAAITEALVGPKESVDSLRQLLQSTTEPDPLVQELIRSIEQANFQENRAFTFAQIGQAFMRHQHWLEASLALQQAVQLDPEYVEARAYLGLALERLGSDGLPHLERAHQQAPSAPLPAFLLSQHWLKVGDPQRALSLAEVAASAEPSDPAYNAQLASAYAGMGDLQTARQYYETAVQLSGGQADFWILLAQFFINNEISLEDKGIPAARQAYQLNPSGRAADLLGYAHLLSGETAVAQRLLSRAVQLEPDLASSHFHYGLTLAEAGHAELAELQFNKALELDPAGMWGELATRALERSETEP